MQIHQSTKVSMIILEYRVVCTEFRLTFSKVFMFSFRSVYHLQTSKLVVEIKGARRSRWIIGVDCSYWIFFGWYMRTLIDEVVNSKDITHLWLMVMYVWLWECLTMYVNNHCLAMFYFNFNVKLRALSFETAAAPNHQVY